MVVFPAFQHLHISRRPGPGADLAGVGLHLLSKGQWGLCGPGRSEAERPRAACPRCPGGTSAATRTGAETRTAATAGVRSHLHDRSERLGGRTYLGSNHHGPHSGKENLNLPNVYPNFWRHTYIHLNCSTKGI